MFLVTFPKEQGIEQRIEHSDRVIYRKSDAMTFPTLIYSNRAKLIEQQNNKPSEGVQQDDV